MSIESPFTHITDLNSSWPDGAVDDVSEGDNHIRGLKTVLLTDFPNIDAAVTADPADLNRTDITTEGTSETSKVMTVSSGDAIVNTGMTWTDLGAVTTADINGGTIDGVALGTTNTGNTESPGNSSTKLATTAFVQDTKWTFLDTFDTTGTTELGNNTSIPSTAIGIKFVFYGPSTIGSGVQSVVLGDSGGYSTTVAGGISSGTINVGFSTVYQVSVSAVAAITQYGTIEFTKLDGVNVWTGSGVVADGSGTVDTSISGGMITLAGALDRCKVTIPSSTFDAGSVDVYVRS